MEESILKTIISGNLEDIKRLIRQEGLKRTINISMSQIQAIERELRRKTNRLFLNALLCLHGSMAASQVWLKEHIHPTTCCRILDDFKFTGNIKERLMDWKEDNKIFKSSWITWIKGYFLVINCYLSS